MPFRLCVEVGGRVLRFPLESGTFDLGSSGECDLVVRHPTISRRHARFEISGETAVLSDLGSSNGTRYDGRLVTGPLPIIPGMKLFFGSVAAGLEVISSDDLETGVAIAETSGGPAPADHPSEIGRSTLGPAVLEVFTLDKLPRLADVVADGAGTAEVAHAVGEALLGSMPCRRVEVVRNDGNREAVLFRGERISGGEIEPVRADAGDGWTLVVEFLSGRMAEAYGGIVRSCAALIRASGRENSSRRIARKHVVADPPVPAPPSLDPTVRKIYSRAAKVAPSRVSILIRGESGTGKEILAGFIHAASDRAEAPLITLNCAALPRDLLEAELFGVERGVATGVDARAGKFEVANGGTLFLDEIGDMAPETQARILRVLQEGEVFRIGGHSAYPADVRIISATNRDIEEMLEDGRFRRDLYHRIADWVIELPPLRRRPADIPNLAVHFLAAAGAERGVRPAGISRAAISALTAYDWPGNIRELEKEMCRAALFLDDGELLDTSCLQEKILAVQSGRGDQRLKAVLERAERKHIERVLGECGGSVSDAARRLGVGQSTLYRRMKALGVE